MTNIKDLLKKTKEKIKSPDVIIDPYDLTIVWTSQKMDKLLGFKKGELEDSRIFKSSEQSQKEETKIQIMMMSLKDHDIVPIPLKTKDEKILKKKLEHVNVEFDNQPYMAGRLVN